MALSRPGAHAVGSVPRSSKRSVAPVRALGSIAFGIAAGLVALELGLRVFASTEGPPSPNIRADSLVAGQDTLVRRELREGVSVSHFSAAGARLTGNAQIPTGPTIILLGDSYVAAEAVADEHTMGSYLERDARAAGVPINVRQYGWVGASPSTYLLVANEVIRRWNPTDVVIALSDNDLDQNALYEARPELRVSASGELHIVPPFPPPVADPPHALSSRSVLAALLAERTWKLEWKRGRGASAKAGPSSAPASSTPATAAVDVVPDSTQLALLPGAVVRALSAAFGARVALVYLAVIGVEGGDTTSTIERKLLEACQSSHVRCATTRRSMLTARHAGVIAHGFFDTRPGDGHLNPAGHALAAAEIWKLLRRPAVQTIAGEVR